VPIPAKLKLHDISGQTPDQIQLLGEELIALRNPSRYQQIKRIAKRHHQDLDLSRWIMACQVDQVGLIKIFSRYSRLTPAQATKYLEDRTRADPATASKHGYAWGKIVLSWNPIIYWQEIYWLIFNYRARSLCYLLCQAIQGWARVTENGYYPRHLDPYPWVIEEVIKLGWFEMIPDNYLITPTMDPDNKSLYYRRSRYLLAWRYLF
jgi:hypothetical protein